MLSPLAVNLLQADSESLEADSYALFKCEGSGLSLHSIAVILELKSHCIRGCEKLKTDLFPARGRVTKGPGNV